MTDIPDKELELTFSDLVQLVRKEYSNERDNIDYARAAKIVDKAIEPQFQQLLTEILGEAQTCHDCVHDDENLETVDFVSVAVIKQRMGSSQDADNAQGGRT